MKQSSKPLLNPSQRAFAIFIARQMLIVIGVFVVVIVVALLTSCSDYEAARTHDAAVASGKVPTPFCGPDDKFDPMQYLQPPCRVTATPRPSVTPASDTPSSSIKALSTTRSNRDSMDAANAAIDAVVNLIMPVADSQNALHSGTAFYIRPNLMLTAAHVTKDTRASNTSMTVTTDAAFDVSLVTTTRYSRGIPFPLLARRPMMGERAVIICAYTTGIEAVTVVVDSPRALFKDVTASYNQPGMPDRTIPTVVLREMTGHVRQGCSGAPVVSVDDRGGYAVVGMLIWAGLDGHSAGAVASDDILLWLDKVGLDLR